MGTKRPFDEDLQEFIKHPKHLDNGNKPDSFGEDKPTLETSQNVEIPGEDGAMFFRTGNGLQSENVVPAPDTVDHTVDHMIDQEFKTSAQLPLPTGINGGQENTGPGPGPVFCSNLFPELFEFNTPRRQLVHYDDTYSSLLNSPPRKEVPVGPDHQADVPEFDPNAARTYRSSVKINVIPVSNVTLSNEKDDCKCMDGGSIRCVQQHVNESRSKLKETLGNEKFVDLGLNEMGEEVLSNWTEQDEQLFHDVVYSNPISLGKRFWEELGIAFPTRTKKELVSYYFNVFMLRRRAVQNRSKLLEIDSDDDEWWGSKKGSFEVKADEDDFLVVGSFNGHGDRDHESYSSEDSDENVEEEKLTSENEQEKQSNGGLKSESYLHWDPPYSTMGPTKGVDLLPTCSMIEEIFGSSKNGES